MGEYPKVIVAGEIDAGKSSLIGRLAYEIGSVSQEAMSEIESISQGLGGAFEFAYLLDSLEEERRGQLTIDTTQVFCKNKKGRDFLFIDVPGHAQLLKNMLSGSSYGDMAILVVDANKSLEAGTRRHANILKFLGIDKVIVVLNKMDLVNFNKDVFAEAKNKILSFLQEIQIKPEYFVPVSVLSGENISGRPKNMRWYQDLSLIGALIALSKKQEERNGSDFYFPIQDIYCVDGKKIPVGTVVSGRLKKGDRVKRLGLDKTLKVESIREFNKNKSCAQAGDSIGIIFDRPDNLRRGDILYKTNPPDFTTGILADIFCIQPLQINARLTFRCLTQEVFAGIRKINKVVNIETLENSFKELAVKAANIAEVVLVTEKPVAVKKFKQEKNLGRFVLQNNKEICAVGVIL